MPELIVPPFSKEDIVEICRQSHAFNNKYEVLDIKNVDGAILNELKVGDVVVKKTGAEGHAYVVSYKQEGHGCCLTYTDASCVETQSYDCNDGVWTYNSEDKTTLTPDH